MASASWVKRARSTVYKKRTTKKSFKGSPRREWRTRYKTYLPDEHVYDIKKEPEVIEKIRQSYNIDARCAKIMYLLMKLSTKLRSILKNFPQSQENDLIIQIRSSLSDVKKFVIQTQFKQNNITTLTELNIQHKILYSLIEEGYNEGFFVKKNPKHTSKEVESLKKNAELAYIHVYKIWKEIGVMIGNWLNETSSQYSKKQNSKSKKIESDVEVDP